MVAVATLAATPVASSVSLLAQLLPSSLECRISHSFFSLVTGLLDVDEQVLRAGLAAFSGSGTGPLTLLLCPGLELVTRVGRGTVAVGPVIVKDVDDDVGGGVGATEVVGATTMLPAVGTVVLDPPAPSEEFPELGAVLPTLCLPLCLPY